MHELEITAPKKVSTDALRADLERIIREQGGKPVDVWKSVLPDRLNAYLQELTMAQGRASEEPISIPSVGFTNRKVYPLYYGVGQLKFYSKPPGLIITMTNDLTVFMEFVPLPGGYPFYYSAKILFEGFDEYSPEFRSLKQNILSCFK